MKISGVSPNQLYASYAKDEKTNRKGTETSAENTDGSADRVEISSEAADRGEADTLAAGIGSSESDADRAERVAGIKAKVQDGSYQVSADSVAGSILGARIDRTA